MSGVYDVAAAQWVRRVTDAAVARVCGDFALERGLGYVDAERVSSITTGDHGRLLLAVVAGSRSHPYSTMVTATGEDTDGEPGWFGRCSCPVQISCKHVVAALLTARELLASGPVSAEPEPAPWRTTLAHLVREAPVAPAAAVQQLGILVTVRRRAMSVRDTTPRVSIELSPTRQTRAGRWSKSAGWTDFTYQHTERTADPRQLRVIRELYALVEHDRVWRMAPGGPRVSLHDLSPKVWPILRRAVDTGVVLVPASDSGYEQVVLAEEPAEVTLRVAGDESGLQVSAQIDHEFVGDARPAPAAEGHLRLVTDQDAMATVHLLGEPGHGVAVLDGTQLSLIPLVDEVDEVTGQLLDHPPLQVPAQDVGEFTALYLPRLRERTAVHTTGPVVEGEPDRLRLVLRLSTGADGVIEVEQLFRYGDAHEVPVTLGVTGRGRRRNDERALVESVTELLRELDLAEPVGGLGWWPVSRASLSAMAAVRLLDRLDELREVDEVVLEVADDLPAYEESTAEPLIQVGTGETADSDWFDLQVEVSLDGEQVPFQQLFEAMARGDTHLVLASGTWFRLDHPALVRLKDLIIEARDLTDPTSASLQLNRFQVGLWEELVSLGVIGEQADAWSESVDRLRQLDKIVTPPRPAGLAAQLRPYQEDGFAWLSTLWDARLGGILADDMGLGKTVQTLALLARAQESGDLGGEAGPVLVVAPTSVVGAWLGEAAKFAPQLRVSAVTETAKKRKEDLAVIAARSDVVVTSYAVLRLDAPAFHQVRWLGLVLDEAQMVKNHRSKTYQAARRIGAPFTLAISGTPLENSLMDLWSLLSLTAPGLYPEPDVFSEHYRRPIESGAQPQLLDQLRRRIRPLMLRRTKAAVAADLPDKQVQVASIPPHPVHARIYEQHLTRERQRILGLLDDPDANRVAILASLTRLRQLALDPALADDRYAGVATSAKISALTEQLREIRQEGHRALVFSQFTTYLQLVQQALEQAGVQTCYLDGSMTSAARTAEVEAFKGGAADAFLISLKAGGVGLTLTEADYVFVLDPWWNPAAEAQAIDRAHRIGQDKPVMVYRMVSRGTIEEKVVALQDRKRELFDRVVDGGGSLSGAITADDIRALLD